MESMSGRSSRSTLIDTKCELRTRATLSSSNDSRSMTWHHGPAEEPLERKIGLSSARAFASASAPHGYQSTGLCACCCRYGETSCARRLVMELLHQRAQGAGGAPRPAPRSLSWLLNRIQQLRRKRAHLEVLALQLLDLKAVEAGVGEKVVSPAPLLLVDDLRQELVDVERLQADLGDHFLEQRLRHLMLQVGHLRVVGHLRLDLPPERLPPLLLVDDLRQELVDVERLQADLGDHFLEQRLRHLMLQVGSD